MIPIRWSAPALEDLRRIDTWLHDEASAEHAVRMLKAVRGRAQSLEHFPRSGRAIEGDAVRMLRATGTPYLIVYRVSDERLDILRIRHERENWRPA